MSYSIFMKAQSNPFWETKTLEQMTTEEWESLCDGCGRCCLNKLEDIDTGELHFTNVACRLLDDNSCRCDNYPQRKTLVPECLVLDASLVKKSTALPASCAYKRLAEGKSLPAWHPLISGDSNTIHLADISVRGKTVSERYIHIEQFEEHIVDWFDNPK